MQFMPFGVHFILHTHCSMFFSWHLEHEEFPVFLLQRNKVYDEQTKTSIRSIYDLLLFIPSVALLSLIWCFVLQRNRTCRSFKCVQNVKLKLYR